MKEASQSRLGLLVGSWRLQSVGITWSDTLERVLPFGADPVGWMILDPTARIMFVFSRSDRQPPSTDMDRAALYRSMTAYTGRVRMDGADRFITTVDVALDPGLRGEQLRFFALEGDRLSIKTPEQTIPQFGDRLCVADLVWVRDG